jgi:thiamine-monophosphate kinase
MARARDLAVSGRITSEADLIATYLAPLARSFPGALALRDDVAVLTPPPGHDLVVTTDAVAAGVHFFPDDAACDIAWKALAVNMSDLAAKGAEPLAYQMALSFPEAPERTWMAEFAEGLAEAQAVFGIALSGGDSDRRPGPLSITITAVGRVAHGRIVQRATARQGDHLFVSGSLGDSALGLKLRRDPDLGHTWGLSSLASGHLLQRYLRPQPRLQLREALLQHAAAAMDLSDGLAKDLSRMCVACGTGAHIRMQDIPLSDPAAQVLSKDVHQLQSILSGGDDYELLIAVRPDASAAFRDAAHLAGIEVAGIGQMTREGGVVIEDPRGKVVQLGDQGWEHF